MPDEPRDHVRRSCLPWRSDDLTECGRSVADVASVIEREQLKWRVKQFGKQRTAFTVCMTCWGTAALFGRADNTWENDASGVLLREYRRLGRAEVTAEVHAIAALIKAHRDEFDQRVTAATEAALFADRRAKERERDA